MRDNKRNRQKNASIIYSRQNKIIHRALNEMGMPYREFKEELFELYADIIGRKALGLSDLTLGERDHIILHYREKGMDLPRPYVSKNLKKWRKGDPEQTFMDSDRPMSVPAPKKRLIAKIEAILTDAERPWKYADSMANHMFGIRFVEWCNTGQLHKIVAALVIDKRRRYA